MALLTRTSLVFEVDGKKILNGLDLALAETEIHALVGANRVF